MGVQSSRTLRKPMYESVPISKREPYSIENQPVGGVLALGEGIVWATGAKGEKDSLAEVNDYN